MLKPQNNWIVTYWKINICLIFSVILYGCSGPKKLNQFDFAKNYKSDGLKYKLNTTLTSINDSITVLKVNMDPNDFLYSKSENSKHIARYTISYRVFKSYNDPIPIDSGNIHYSLKESTPRKQIQHSIKMYAPISNNYIVDVGLYDENRDFKTNKIIHLNKLYHSSASYYNIIGDQNNGFYQSDSFYIKSISIQTPNQLKVYQYSYNITCAPAPQTVNYNMNFDAIPDSTWCINIKTSNKLPALKNGYYYFETDSVNKTGFSVFCTNKNFPNIESVDVAIRSFGYLLDKNKYAELIRSETPKKDFERTWIQLAGNRQRARNLIKSYYKEVTKANELFSCNEPGWATDRGMIYIIYGAPRIVYRYDNKEIWIYGEENNLLSEQFEFRKIDTPISDCIYELRRNINYKVSWNRMVTSWIEDRGY